MCSSIPPKIFQMDSPLGPGAGNTITPDTVYASSANPSLVDSSKAPGTAPAIPAKPAAPGTGTNLGQGAAPNNNPFLQALAQIGM